MSFGGRPRARGGDRVRPRRRRHRAARLGGALRADTPVRLPNRPARRPPGLRRVRALDRRGPGQWFTRVSIANPVLATMVMLAFVVLGLFSYQRLSVDQFPERRISDGRHPIDIPARRPEIVEAG